MNLPISSIVMLIAMVAPFYCQRLQNEFELVTGNFTQEKDNSSDDLNEISELTTTMSVLEEDVTISDDADESSTDNPLTSNRQGRKLELKDAVGRFSIKEKLCSLGLADCTPKERDIHVHSSSIDHSNIEYVQPVKVVPDGPPIPAVSVHNKKQDISGSYDAPALSDNYGPPRPSYDAPAPVYNSNRPSYDGPSTTYGVPKPSYESHHATKGVLSSTFGTQKPAPPNFDAHRPQNGAPKSSYDAQEPSHYAPASTYDAPNQSFNHPVPTYDVPKPSYSAPTSSYGAPAPTKDVPSYSAPTPSYNSPAPTYDVPKPSSSYGAPVSVPKPLYNSPNSPLSSSYGTPSSIYESPKPATPVYEPSQPSYKSYQTKISPQSVPMSNQVAPVYIPSASGYDSPVGTRLDPEDYDDEYYFNEDDGEVQAESFRHDRKLDDCQCVPSFQCPVEDILNFSNLIGSNNGQQSLEEFGQLQTTTTGDVATSGFEAVKDYSILIDPRTLPKDVLAQDNSDTLDLSEENSTTTETLFTTTTSTTSTTSSSTTSASARFRRDENPQTRAASEEEFSPNEVIPEYDLYDDEEAEGSGDSEVLTRDGATIELGSGDGLEATEGRIFEGIPSLANLLNFSTPKIGGVEPTVGVSFGLPQYGQNYGGQPLNYLNTGTAINPYYGGGGPANGPNGVPSRISLGAVDINPLISFQSVANDKGELIKKPLINLHVTPNGCGIFGCDDGSYEDYGYQGSNPNPLAGLANLLPGFGKPSYNHGPSSQYHSPPPPGSTYGSPLPPPTYESGFKSRPGSFEETAPIYYNSFKTSPQPNYNHQPPPPQPQPSYHQPGSVKFGEPQAQLIKHEHHHYHYGSGNSPVQNGPNVPQGVRFGVNENNPYNQGQFYDETYGRSVENDTSENNFNEDNTVKRNTHQLSFGMETEKKGESGFKFPKGRSLEQETSSRKKRNSNQVNKIKRESRPTGLKAPTCGGQSSGYVCCRSSRGQAGNRNNLPAVNSQFNNFGIDTTIRNPKSQEPISKPHNLISSSNQNKLNSKPGQCGKRNAHGVNGRIASSSPFINGDTDFAEYPWQVAVLKKDQLDNMYVCGGSLIDSQHILTAAHCVKNYQAGQLRVRVGEWDVNNDSEFYRHIEFDVSKIAIHEDFYPGNLFNDIAIIRINGFVDFDKNIHISPACLPDRFFDFTGSRCQVTGWGKDAFTKGSYQQVLKEVEVPVINNQRCESLLRQTRLGPDFALHPGFLCAGGEEGRDACTGDGGGPLVCEANGVWQLVGIVSWGVGCGERDVPGVYVKVAMYEAWIQKQISTQ